MDATLPDIARSTVAQRGLLLGARAVVAMVSGGADSTALLRFLAEEREAAGAPETLSVLHVDHTLRGDDSTADAVFVSALSSSLGLPCRVVRYDVAAYAAEEGLNLEDAGRRVRYRFADEELDAVCEAGGIPADAGRIATAHTFDDRLETFLMRLASGAGPGGLASIRHARGRVIRPLLDASRTDVVAYLEALGQGWREDVTNTDTARMRARVRHEVLPELERINPSLRATLRRTLEVTGDEDELLSGMADAFAVDFSSTKEGEVSFDRERMKTLSRPMARRSVRSALLAAFPEASRIEFEHVEALVDGMAEDGFARHLPDGLRARTEYDRLIVRRERGERAPLAPTLLPVPGEATLGDAGSVLAEEVEPTVSDPGRDEAVVDADLLRGTLTVDGVREGDRMRPLGMEGTKKLGDLLTDEKVPQRERRLVPVVRDGERVVWLAGVRMSEDYRVGPETKRAIRLRWQRNG